MNVGGHEFREVWAVDFEFSAPDGERPTPMCLVAKELTTGRTIRLWQDDLRRCERAPFDTGRESLVVAYYSSAEFGCFLALGWSLPANVLDLFCEFRNATNGLPTPCGAGLLGALTYYGLDGIDAAEKESLRQLALRGGPYTDAERAALLDYCEADVLAVEKLLRRMAADVDLPRALLRGRYMGAAAAIERRGSPIDLPMLGRLRDRWEEIQDCLIERIDSDYGVYNGRTFKADRWAAWLSRNNIPWPRLPTGSLALDDDTFREMARSHPAVAPIRELRVSLSQLRLRELAVGSDGRNRCLLSAFRSRTGRNQPSSTRYIFGPAVWLCGLIRPDPWAAAAYVDWSQQEFGIAAALSGDAAMQAAYISGDPYLEFAKQAGAVPPDATKASHGPTRELFKACVLATNYGMGADALAARIGQPPIVARELLRKHRETYRRFWEWSDAAVSHAMLRGTLQTVFGWTIRTGIEVNPRSLANFPMQANGAEMLRLACVLAVERGVEVCAPVHDAILIEAGIGGIEAAVGAAQLAMADASEIVLGGFRLRTDAKVFADRYTDPRGERMWDVVQAVLGELPADDHLLRRATGTCCAALHPSTLITFSFGNRYDPRPTPVAATTKLATETIETTASTPRQTAVSAGADPLAVALSGLLAAGQGGPRRPSPVALGRVVTVAGGEVEAVRSPGIGRPAVGGGRGVSGNGTSGADRGGPQAGASGDGAAARLAADHELMERWAERSAIKEFDGGLRRDVAEAQAAIEVFRAT